MGRTLAAFIFCAVLAMAAQYKLYLKDGGFHRVREHQELGDRVRYYSVERGEWEEIPTELVDLKKTKAELAARVEETEKEAKMLDAEARVERELRRITASIPEQPGVYTLGEGGKVTAIKQADVTIVTDKKRQVLKVLSPLPMVAGKSTAEIAGEKSANIYSERRPEFYFRTSRPQQMALVQMQMKKGVRVVEVIQVVPVSKEKIEERKEIEIFRQQLDEGLYKVWPQADLTVGEYAWIEFTEGQVNLQVWDFRIE